MTVPNEDKCSHGDLAFECPDCLATDMGRQDSLNYGYLAPQAEAVRDRLRAMQGLNRELTERRRSAADPWSSPAWCACGDQIVEANGGTCGNCLAAFDDPAALDLRARTAEARVKELEEALRGLVDWCFLRPGETEADRYERIAEAFHRETGHLRPGKSVPLERGGYNEEERLAAWMGWAAAKNLGLESRARAALKGTK